MKKKILTVLLKPETWVAKLILIGFALGILSLGVFDYLEPIKNFLDSEKLSFKIGEIKFSLYRLIKSVISIVILFWMTGISSEFGEKRIKSIKGIRPSNKALIAKMFQIFLYLFAFVLGLDLVGIDFTALAIFSGAVGIGIGIGLQKITSNFISGLILLFEKSVENDDLVELSDGTYGFVRNTGARYTLLETFESREIMIPNEDFITNRVTNWTYSDSKGRVDIPIGVSYDSDIEKVMKLMLEAAEEYPRCMRDPAPICYLREFGESSVKFLLFFWIADVTEGLYQPQSDVMRAIWKKLKAHNIRIPYPQRDIHIKTDRERI